VHSDKAADTSNVGVNLISVLYHFCLSLVKPHFCVKLPLYHISHTKGMDSLKVSIPYFAGDGFPKGIYTIFCSQKT